MRRNLSREFSPYCQIDIRLKRCDQSYRPIDYADQPSKYYDEAYSIGRQLDRSSCWQFSNPVWLADHISRRCFDAPCEYKAELGIDTKSRLNPLQRAEVERVKLAYSTFNDSQKSQEFGEALGRLKIRLETAEHLGDVSDSGGSGWETEDD